jgi:hypothetical protein
MLPHMHRGSLLTVSPPYVIKYLLDLLVEVGVMTGQGRRRRLNDVMEMNGHLAI